jgi:hypothetical protein
MACEAEVSRLKRAPGQMGAVIYSSLTTIKGPPGGQSSGPFNRPVEACLGEFFDVLTPRSWMLTPHHVYNLSKVSTGLYRSGRLRIQDSSNTISMKTLSAHD